ncbi:MAG: hypothetical protein QQN48_02900, partial [Nitrosopumilus sp.]
GTAIQTNSITLETLAFSVIAGILSYVLIKTSRKYKDLKQLSAEASLIFKKEVILKLVSVGVIFVTVALVLIRYL